MARGNRRRRGRNNAPAPQQALPQPPPPPPPVPAPPRRRVPPFTEPKEYAVPQNLITGNEEVDAKNRQLASIYTEIAGYREDIHKEKGAGAIANIISFERSVAALRELIDQLRSNGASIRQNIASLNAVAFLEPKIFSNPM